MVRSKAVAAISALVPHLAKVDSLLTEIQAGLKSTDSGVQESCLYALDFVVRLHPALAEPHRSPCRKLIQEQLFAPEESLRRAAALAFGSYCLTASDAEVLDLFKFVLSLFFGISPRL